MSSNILEPLVDNVIELTKLSGKLIYKLLKIEPMFDIENYFKVVELKNKRELYPKEIKRFKSKLGYTYVFSIPIGLSIEDFNKHKSSIEAQVNKPINIEFKNGYVHITVIEKVLEKIINYKLPIREKSEGIKIPIGESLDEVIVLDLKENPHSYIVGTTGSGKSVCTKGILTSICNTYRPYEVEIYLCDLKRVELNLFRNLKHTKSFVFTVEDTTNVIANLLAETNRRYDLFLKHNVTSIFEYNKLFPHKKLKYQILFIEEIVMLLEDSRKKAMKLLKQLIAISRASGLYCFLTTQRPSSDIIDSVVKSNINNRIVFKCEDSKNSIVALDTEGAETLEGKGHGIIKRGSIKQEFRGYYITDQQVKEYTNKYIAKPPKWTSKSNSTPIPINISNSNSKAIEGQIEAKEVDILEDLSFLDKL